MSLSFIIWVSISLFLLSFWLWSVWVVLRQKKAWKVFAEKRKMRFHSRGMMETPSINGVVDGYNVTIFASEHSELDARTEKRLTAIEVSLHTGLPVPCAVASAGMVPIVEGLRLNQEYKPAIKGWDDSYVIRTNDRALSQYYFEGGRMEKVINLMQIDKAWVILIFLDETGLLRLDTPLPIDNPKEMDILVKQMINVAKALELKAGEDKDLLRKRMQSAKESPVLDIDDDLLSDDIGFELEDDTAVETDDKKSEPKS